MSPREVEGLQSLAMAHGGSLSINPQTGLPEASFLSAILPTVGGMALSPFMGPLGAGLLMGGLTALTTGDIGKGLMAGFGGFSGAGLGQSLTNLAKGAGGIPAGAGSGIAESLPAGGVGNLSMFTNPQATSVMGGVGDVAQFGSAGQYAQNVADLTKAVPGPNFSQIAGATQGTGGYSGLPDLTKSFGGTGGTYGDIAEGASKLASDPMGQWEKFTTPIDKGGAGGSAMQLISPVSSIAMDYLQPQIPKPYVDPDTGKWRGDEGQLNLSDKWKTNLVLPTYAAEGGYIDGYAVGGVVSNAPVGGGISGLYSQPDGNLNNNISQDGYGIGRLANLAKEQSLDQAKIYGYKVGGYLDGAGDGMSDSIPATIEDRQPARLADGEFVVPADVVSHLGNGSSKAGSKRLYAMLDKVRKARTGHTKQGKQIKPEKYMPA
jgi:hypothetical protein